MPHILKNKNLEVHIDLPLENYQNSRFDWTGKIRLLKFQDTLLSNVERMDMNNETDIGRGLYNEFGIDTALGFEEADVGGWFHKIGIGLLKKEGNKYLFHKNHEIKPAKFEVNTAQDKLIINCISDTINGYAYILRKEIELFESSFSIQYQLENTGTKVIRTDEYVHNFLAIGQDAIGQNYSLTFPFQLQPDSFEETVNPEKKVKIGVSEVSFKATPQQPFFFSNLSGNQQIEAAWELVHHQQGIGISETGDFRTDKVNLWGWKHVISPELFFKIELPVGQAVTWSRRYHTYRIHPIAP